MLLKDRMGLLGIIIIVFFTLIALLAPLITTVSPNQSFVSGYWAVPSWATIFPAYSGVPPNTEALNPSMSSWTVHVATSASISNISYSIVSDAMVPAPLLTKSYYGNNSASNSAMIINAEIKATPIAEFVPIANLSESFTYNYRPPYNFFFGLFNKPIVFTNLTDYYYLITLTRPDGKVFSLTSYTLMAHSSVEDINYEGSPGFHLGSWAGVILVSNTGDVVSTALGSGRVVPNAGQIFLNGTGTYKFNIALIAASSTKPGTLSVAISNPFLFVEGRQYGLLGTDNFGRDLWSQFAYGSRISIEVGLLASIITVGVGTLVGLIAGIYLGITDEFLMRVADVILVIPFLPLAIVVIFVITQSPALESNLYFWLIVLFAIISWPGLARIIRSQTLSLKERGYVESAVALGGSHLYIVRKHLLPSVMGLVYAELALSVPSFILTEAALDFLLPSSSNVPTWGRMVSLAYDNAASSSVYAFGWWWFIFPGLAIVLLSLAFVLLGYALDAVFNPRLRKR